MDRLALSFVCLAVILDGLWSCLKDSYTPGSHEHCVLKEESWVNGICIDDCLPYIRFWQYGQRDLLVFPICVDRHIDKVVFGRMFLLGCVEDADDFRSICDRIPWVIAMRTDQRDVHGTWECSAPYAAMIFPELDPIFKVFV